MAIITSQNFWPKLAIGVTGTLAGAYIGGYIGAYFGIGPCLSILEKNDQLRKGSLPGELAHCTLRYGADKCQNLFSEYLSLSTSLVPVLRRTVHNLSICALAVIVPSASLGALSGCFITNRLLEFGLISRRSGAKSVQN